MFCVDSYLSKIFLITLVLIWCGIWWYVDNNMHDGIRHDNMVYINKNKYDLSENIKPYYPSLIIIGPPKCGTTTITHTFGNMSNWIRYPGNNGENHFFNGANKYRCIAKWNTSKWKEFIDKFERNEISILSLNESINDLCPIHEYFAVLSSIVGPLFNDSKHYYIESAPSYQRNPIIPIIFSLYLPKTKLLQIIRNPLKFIWSWNWHFFGKKHKKSMKETELWLQWKYKGDALNNGTVYELNNLCTNIKNNDNQQNRKNMMIKYLYLRFVEQKIEPKVRRDAFIWASNYLSTFLFYLYVYDQVYGENNWNQFKVIQFEWFYKRENTKIGLFMIREWMMGIKKAKTNWNPNEINIEKKEHKAKVSYSDEFKMKMKPLFNDCNDVLINIILKQRPNLLIGDWINW